MRRIILLLASIALAVILGSGVALADSPTTKEDCKNGGYAKYGFKNQGQCIKAVSTAPPLLNTEIATPCPTDPVDSGEQVTWDIETTPAGLDYQWRLAYETLEDENNVFAWRDPRSSNEPLVYNSSAGPNGGYFRLEVRAVAADGSVDQTPATCRYWVNPSQPPATEGKVVTGSITPWHEQVTFPLIEGNDLTFTWQVTGYYDLVQCRLHRVNPDNTLTNVTPWEECTSLTKTYTDLPDGNYRLSVAVVQYERSNAQTYTHFRVDSHQFGAPTETAGATLTPEAGSFPITSTSLPIAMQTFTAQHSGELVLAQAHLAHNAGAETTGSVRVRIFREYQGFWYVAGSDFVPVPSSPEFVTADFNGVWVEEGQKYALGIQRQISSDPVALWTAGSPYLQGGFSYYEGGTLSPTMEGPDAAFSIKVAPYITSG
jgi:hypothetical protein